MTKFLPIFSLFFLYFMLLPAISEPQYGISAHGTPALPPDFAHLPYANPSAPQGGELRQAVLGSFDSLNPFIIKGQPATGIRSYVFESLMGRNLAEPFALYGLLAETIDLSDDHRKFRFILRHQARFSDGHPVTSADVAFSLTTLRDMGSPNFKNSYRKITHIETPTPHEIIFTQDSDDRELPMIIALMPILPEHAWKNKNFDASTLDPLIGSGPYTIASVQAGETIIYQKNQSYWGRTLNINKGLWNFDRLRFSYYRDDNTAFEAFKRGDVDLRIETDPTRWSAAYNFSAVKDGKVLLDTVPSASPAPAVGFMLNTRRKIFQNIKLREALIIAFDFEWANANLFSNLYQRIYGYYSGSSLSSFGKAVDETERKILGNAFNKLRSDFRDGTYRSPVSDGSGHDRKNLRLALNLLHQAGYELREKALVDKESGAPLSFTIMLQGTEYEKIALHFQRTLALLGINTELRIVDSAPYIRALSDYSYDITVARWYNSLSPGNEQSFYFGSYGRNTPGTRNFPGIADPDIDRLINKLLAATSETEFATIVRALDRLLVAGFYMIPFYTIGGQWVAHWNWIGVPESFPLPGFEITTLWRN